MRQGQCHIPAPIKGRGNIEQTLMALKDLRQI